MTRLAFFDDRFFEVYGAQENVLLLAEAARDAGHDVIFVTTAEGALSREARRRQLNTMIVEAPDRLRVFERGAVRGGVTSVAKSAVAALRYSLKLHTRLKAAGIEIVIAAAVRPAILLARSRLPFGPKVLLFAQNSIPFGFFAAAALPGIDLVAPIASGAMMTFPSWSLRVFKPHTELMPSGRSLEEFETLREPSLDRRLRVVSVGSLTERKGFHVLLESVDLLVGRGHDLELVIVGGTNGEESSLYAEGLEALVAEKGLPVTFAGWQDDVRPYLARADVFALASSHEGLPGAIIEAMASGLPVVTTDAGGCSDAVSPDCGFVVPVGRADMLADRLDVLADPTTRASMGKQAKKRAQDMYSVEAFYSRFSDLIEQMNSRD